LGLWRRSPEHLECHFPIELVIARPVDGAKCAFTDLFEDCQVAPGAKVVFFILLGQMHVGGIGRKRAGLSVPVKGGNTIKQA
jgi:hypothetical protein